MEESVSTATSSAPVETAPASEPSSTPTDSFQPSDAGSAQTARLVVDNETGSRTVEFGNGNAEQPPVNDNAMEKLYGNEEPNYYSQQELLAAIQSGTAVDSRVSPEHKAFLTQLGNAYAQQQQIMAQRQAQMAEAQRLQSQSDMQAFSEMQKQAQLDAAKALNIAQDDIDALDYMENGEELKGKLDAQTQQLLMDRQRDYYRQRFENERQLQEFTTNLNQIASFCRAEKANEPQFETILKTMDENLDNMPYKVGARLKMAENNIQAGRCSQADLDLFRNAYNETKKFIYQKVNGVSSIPQRTQVPKVERSGFAGADIRGIDLSSLRGASPYDRSATIQQWIRQQL